MGNKPFENTVGKEIARNKHFLSNLKLWIANSFSLEESKVCRLVMGSGEWLCQFILKSIRKCRSYGLNKMELIDTRKHEHKHAHIHWHAVVSRTPQRCQQKYKNFLISLQGKKINKPYLWGASKFQVTYSQTPRLEMTSPSHGLHWSFGRQGHRIAQICNKYITVP